MEVRDLQSWGGFNKKILELNKLRKKLSQEKRGQVSEILFRGQSNACWSLDTTLERYLNKYKFDAWDYFETTERLHAEIASFTGKTWGIDPKEFDKWVKNYDPLFGRRFPAQEYMIYLRQHGFPSPFLDWTRSPYIAAYFAFYKIHNDVKRVAIYAYLEWGGGGKSQSSNKPVITSIPERGPSHRRHYIQQCKYTICSTRCEQKIFFGSHEKAFSETQNGQNLLWKFTFPRSKRIEFLRYLDQMNINSVSLFNTEDSLMETVALREFVLSNEANLALSASS